MRTRIPLSAISWAMPPPMTPAPSTATARTGPAGAARQTGSFLAASVRRKTWMRFFEIVDVASSATARASASKPAAAGRPRVPARPRWTRERAPGSARRSSRQGLLARLVEDERAPERGSFQEQP